MKEAHQLSDIHHCPECNGRLRHIERRRYYCGHCKKRYRIAIEAIKAKLVEDTRK